MKKTVLWGILSTARINRRLIPELHASDRCALAGVASRDPERGRAYAGEWKIPRSYGSYEALLADPDIDVVYIPLPNDLHTPWVVRALESGKHVLCEKPLCLSAHELGIIRRVSAHTGKSVMEAFMYRHHPQTALFKQIVEDGLLGPLRAMYSEFAATINRPPDNYRMDAERGGGVLWDIGVYPISLFRYLDTSQVRGTAARATFEHGIDKNVWGRLDFASGVTAQFFASFESEYSTRTSIMGVKGRLDITHPFNGTHDCQAWITVDGKRTALSLPQASLYAGEIENMNDVVLQNRSPLFTLDNSWQVLEVVERIRGQISQ